VAYAKLSDRDVPVLAEWTPLPEAAKRLGFSRQYAYKRAADGYFTSLHRVGEEFSTYIVSTAEVDEKAKSRTDS
jgi:predicted DNA-binding transcriptional regulator AlpA